MFQKFFSPKGEIGRLTYLINGLIIPIIVLVVFSLLAQLMSKEIGGGFVLIGLLLGLYIGLIATYKRANQTASSNGLVLLLWFLLTPIGIIYLLLAPAKKENAEKSSGFLAFLVVGVFGLLILGILLSVAIPKFAQHDNNQTTQQSLPHVK